VGAVETAMHVLEPLLDHLAAGPRPDTDA
jgi:hypothetical protein